jgi:hypothetical protein
MTTRILVVNYGPDVVEVQKVDPKVPADTQQPVAPTALHPQQAADFYVHDFQEIHIKEV